MKAFDKKRKKTLLSDTKLTEDIIELVFGGDLSGDLAEVLQSAVDIEGQ